MCRTAGEGCKEEKSSKGKPEAGARHRVEAAFHCQTCEDTAVEQKVWQELRSFYIVSAHPAPFPWLQGHLPRPRDSSNSSHSLSQPEREGMFHRGAGLNLTSGQYTAPIAGYYSFTSTLHIGEPPGRPRALPGQPGLALSPCSVQPAGSRAGRGRDGDRAACGCSSVCSPAAGTTGTVGQGQRAWEGGRSLAALGKEGPAAPTTTLPLLQPFGDCISAGEQQ